MLEYMYEDSDPNVKMRERSYILKEDLKVPGEDVQRAAVEKVMKDRNNIYKAGKTFVENLGLDNDLGFGDVADVLSASTPDKLLEMREKVRNMSASEYRKAYQSALAKIKESEVESYVKNLTDPGREDIYEWQSKAVSENSSIRNQVIYELEKQGYNAMVEQYAVGGTSKYDAVKGIEPLIIFDHNKNLELKSESDISPKESMRATDNYIRWVRKARKQQRKNGSW